MSEKQIIEKQREIFKKFMQVNELNANAWAKKSGVTESTIRHYLNGRTQSLTSLVLEKLASSIGANIGDLISNQVDHDVETQEFLSFDRALLLKTLKDAEEYIANSKIILSPEQKAKIFMAWYDLSKLVKAEKREQPADEMIGKILSKIG